MTSITEGMSSPEAVAGPPDVLACHDCGLVQISPQLARNAEADCARCGATLAREHTKPITGAFIWVLTALFLAIPAYTEPVFDVSAAGIHRSTRVDGTVTALVNEHYGLLAIPLALFAIALPIVWLGCLSFVLSALKMNYRPPWLGRFFRYALELDDWAMPDVFVMGGFVAYTRLQAVTRVEIADGGYTFLAFAFACMMVRVVLDRHFVWQAIMPDPTREPGSRELLCPNCGLLLPMSAHGKECPRCATAVYHRKHNSLNRAAALVGASYLLYIPANLIPVLNVTRLGRSESDTIFGGVIELAHARMWPLVAIVLTASIFVPLLKLLGLTWFMIGIKSRSQGYLRTRTRFYRVISVIGRWSNIDVFMIGLLADLVDFGNLATIRPEPGAIAFAGVVVLTMFASHAFDARLMWDAAGERNVK